MNADHEQVAYTLQPLSADAGWQLLLDTSQTEEIAEGQLFQGGQVYKVSARSFVLFVQREQGQDSNAQ